MSRATEAAFDGLHALVAQVLTDALKGKGEASPSPQMIAQAIKFLKDNGIDAPAKSGRVSDLVAALADIDLEEVANSGLRPN